MDYIIETKDLIKRYGKFQAVNGVSLEVPAGQFMGSWGQTARAKPLPCVC